MAGKTKLGAMEFRLTFTPMDGGEPVEVVSSPSMFALADEFTDTIRAKGGHTEEWMSSKLAGAIFVLAARDAGLMPDGPLDLASIAEVMNAYDIDMEDPEPGEENPTTAAL